MDEQRMKEIFSDGAFVKELLDMETPAQVQMAFKGKGVNLTEAEVVQIRDQINKHIESGAISDELSLDQLDDVAGGLAPLLIGIAVLIAAVGGAVAGRKLNW